ncbi:hypothetical protein C4559_02050 [Candidatus Microgenomates bacterium]|nr:MAG: hypothetical protein C4559_02050 [Candidatus Microgenomates bacterium]
MKKEIVFKKGNLPKKNKFILALLLLKFPLIIPGLKHIIKKHLINCRNIDFLPGFFFYQGNNIYAQDVHFGDTMLMDYVPIKIGRNTCFGWHCMILTAYHDFYDSSVVHAKEVIIGKNVSVYSGTIILGGVKIGDNSVIGAGSVVTKNIPSNCLAAGNPARVIKYLKKRSD